MKDFLLIFRSEKLPDVNPSPEEMQTIMKHWDNWMGSIAAQNKLVDRGNRLGTDGRVVKPGSVVTNGPFAEIKEFVGGFTIIRANDADDAAEVAKGCPILHIGGTVEVREVLGH